MVQAPGPGNAVEKVLVVLDALTDHHRLADLARSTGLPKSTVHRILQTLIDRDFAAFDDVTGYGPGPRMLGLAGRTLGDLDASLAAEPVLRRLQELSSATVHMAVLAGDEAIYVRKLEGNKPYRMVSRVGMAIPLHCTAIGKALLAAMPDEEVVELMRRTGLPRRTPRTITTPECLLDDLQGHTAASLVERRRRERARHRVRGGRGSRPFGAGDRRHQRVSVAQRSDGDRPRGPGPPSRRRRRRGVERLRYAIGLNGPRRCDSDGAAGRIRTCGIASRRLQVVDQSKPSNSRSLMYLTITGAETCGMSLSGPILLSCTAARK